MKPQETKTEYVRLRAEGKSFTYIADQLHISKSTCSSWENELREQITELKQEQLNELYDSYFMGKEARIRKLGDALAKIDDALDQADLTQMPPEKLLDYKLKYTEALKEEYTGSSAPYTITGSVDPAEIVNALGDLLNRIRAGEITGEQANKESTVLSNLLKAYDAVELKAKIDALEAVLGSRE